VILFQTLWKWLEQGGHSINSGSSHGATSGSGGVIGLNEANLKEIDAKTSATTWREFSVILNLLLT
jgi:hypothetical protein